MVHMVRTFPSTNPFQWWLSRDVWWFWGASKKCWGWPRNRWLFRLLCCSSLPRAMDHATWRRTPQNPGGRGMGDGNDTHWFKGKSWEHHAKIWELLHKCRFSSGKKWRHSGCSPAMLDYWYFGGSWDLTKMVEKLDWPDFSVKGATAENWIKYIQVFMS